MESPAAFIDDLLDGVVFGTVMAAATLWSLFADNIRQTLLPPSSDGGFLVGIGIVAALFALEMLLRAAINKDGYLFRPLAPAAAAAAPRGEASAWESPSPAPPPASASGRGQSTLRWAWAAALSASLRCLSVGSFQFYLDVFALASMAIEISTVAQDLVPVTEGTSLQSASSSAGEAAFMSFARAGRASRAGARAGQLVRLATILSHLRTPGQSAVDSVTSPVPAYAVDLSLKAGEEEPPPPPPTSCCGRGIAQARHFSRQYEYARRAVSSDTTRVGSRLTEVLTQRVILGVLLLIIVVPLLSYNSQDQSRLVAASQAFAFTSLAATDNATYGPALLAAARVMAYGTAATAHSSWSFAALNMNGSSLSTWFGPGADVLGKLASSMPPSSLRRTELTQIVCEGHVWYDAGAGRYVPFNLTSGSGFAPACDGGSWAWRPAPPPGTVALPWSVKVYFDMRPAVHMDAIFNVALMVLILFTIAAGSYGFTKAASRLVLKPLEKMVVVVKRLVRNPLASRQELLAGVTMADRSGAVKPLFVLDLMDGRRAEGARDSPRTLALDVEGKEAMETRIIMRMLLNMGPLLRLGFGRAGAHVLTRHLNDAGEVVPTARGTLVHVLVAHVRLSPILAGLMSSSLATRGEGEKGASAAPSRSGLTVLRRPFEQQAERPRRPRSEAVAASSDGAPSSAVAEEAIVLINALYDVVHAVATAHGARVGGTTEEGTTLHWVLPGPDARAVSPLSGSTPWTAVADAALLALQAIQVTLAQASPQIVGLPLPNRQDLELARSLDAARSTSDGAEEEARSPSAAVAIRVNSPGLVGVPSFRDRLRGVWQKATPRFGAGSGQAVDIEMTERRLAEDPQPGHMLSLAFRRALHALLQPATTPNASLLVTTALHGGWGVESLTGSDHALGTGISSPHAEAVLSLSSVMTHGEEGLTAGGSLVKRAATAPGEPEVEAAVRVLRSLLSLPPPASTSHAAPPLPPSRLMLTHPVACLLSPSLRSRTLPVDQVSLTHATSLSGLGVPVGFDPWAVPVLGTAGEERTGLSGARGWDGMGTRGAHALLGVSSAWADQVRMFGSASRARDSWKRPLVLFRSDVHPGLLAAISGAAAASPGGGSGEGLLGRLSRAVDGSPAPEVFEAMPFLDLDDEPTVVKAGLALPAPSVLASWSVPSEDGLPRLADPSRAWPMRGEEAGEGRTSAPPSPGRPSASRGQQSWSEWDSAAFLERPGREADLLRVGTSHVTAGSGQACMCAALSLIRGLRVSAYSEEYNGEAAAQQAQAALKSVRNAWPQAADGVAAALGDRKKGTNEASAAVLLVIAWRLQGYPEAAALLAQLTPRLDAGAEAFATPLLPRTLIRSRHVDGVGQIAALVDTASSIIPGPTVTP